MLRKTKVYLRGAYGPGNLGDDVLLLCMIKILKKMFKGDEIAVSVNDIKVAKLLDNDVNWVPINSPVFSDIAILGGGGQFFSFKNSGSINIKNPLNFLKDKKSEGYTIIDLILGFILRKIYGIGYKAKKLATFCIGVGPFENGYDKEYNRALKVFNKADFISVRDSKSKIQVIEMCDKMPNQFVDITLNRDLWYDGKQNFLKKKNLNSKPVIGIVIRDWKLNDSGSQIINQLLDFEKLHPNYDCVYISFYQKYDENILDKLVGRKVLIWNPESYTVSEFILKLRLCDVVVSSRAHGVLLPTMAYIPTIAVEIEQKLKAVHQMMPLSTKLIKAGSLNGLSEMIDTCLDYDQDFIKRVDDDLMKNSLIAKDSIVKLEEWLINATE
jgi:polysaccharide pyruvyl transferase WcaK-like protein|tara:strand:+ start:334 stop:1482 length:1149 start_codon:yes stop_codon:yes gene_type:complete